MAKNCDNCGHCYIEQIIHVCGRNEGRLPLFDGDGNCKGWKKKRITNGDNFRAMTDEELAEVLINLPNHLGCNDPNDGCMMDFSEDKLCFECVLKWLRQECE